jgi:hypothetical protein
MHIKPTNNDKKFTSTGSNFACNKEFDHAILPAARKAASLIRTGGDAFIPVRKRRRSSINSVLQILSERKGEDSMQSKKTQRLEENSSKPSPPSLEEHFAAFCKEEERLGRSLNIWKRAVRQSLLASFDNPTGSSGIL